MTATSRARLLSKFLLALLFIAAGANHFRRTNFYVRIMPPYLPWHTELVYLSGVFEVLLGALLLAPKYERLAAWGLIAVMIAVFPANLQMALHADDFPEFPPIVIWLRLPLQIPLIAWAYLFTRRRVVA